MKFPSNVRAIVWLLVFLVGFLLFAYKWLEREKTGEKTLGKSEGKEFLEHSQSVEMILVSDAAGTNKASVADENFKVITDRITGEYAVVTSNNRLVELKDSSGKTFLTINVFDYFTNSSDADFILCSRGRSIESMTIGKDGDLRVSFCRDYISINPKSGKIYYRGRD